MSESLYRWQKVFSGSFLNIALDNKLANMKIANILTGIPIELANTIGTAYRVCLESQEPVTSGLREMTYDEFMDIYRKVTENEAECYHGDPEERMKFLDECMEDAQHTWDRRIHAYTIDGRQGLVTVTNKDGTAYIYLVYVPEGERGTGTGSLLIRQAIQDSPQGISLHTAKDNDEAYRLYSRLGFKEYPSVDPGERFMATKPGIGGNEWWTDEEKEL